MTQFAGILTLAGNGQERAFESPFCLDTFLSGSARGEITMTDADTNVVTVTRCSTFDRAPIDIGDPLPSDLDRLAASLDYLKLRFGPSSADETGQWPSGECVDEHRRLGGVALVA